MVMGYHTAFRCKKCGEVFFKPKGSGQGLLHAVRKVLGPLACPKCGSRDVYEDKTVKT